MSHKDVFSAITVKISGIDAHTCLSLSVSVDSSARQKRIVDKRAILLVKPELVGISIIGNINVDPTIVVEIRSDDGVGDRSDGVLDPGQEFAVAEADQHACGGSAPTDVDDVKPPVAVEIAPHRFEVHRLPRELSETRERRPMNVQDERGGVCLAAVFGQNRDGGGAGHAVRGQDHKEAAVGDTNPLRKAEVRIGYHILSGTPGLKPKRSKRGVRIRNREGEGQGALALHRDLVRDRVVAPHAAVIRVVIPRRERERPEEDAALHLRAEPLVARPAVHLAKRLGSAGAVTVADAVVTREVRARLGRRHEVIGRHRDLRQAEVDLVHARAERLEPLHGRLERRARLGILRELEVLPREPDLHAAEVETIGRALEQEYPDDNRGKGLRLAAASFIPGNLALPFAGFATLVLGFVSVIAAGFVPAARVRAQDTFTMLQPVKMSTTTGEKPQSKVWYHAGAWWAVFPTSASGASSAGTWLWKLDGTAWTEVIKLSDRTDVKADARALGTVTHILLYAGANTQLVSVEYGGGSYQFWTDRPAPSPISLSGSEIATIEVDSTGRMWLATENDATGQIVVYYSNSPYSTWSAPFTLASGVNSDDIAVVVKLPNKIGVLWSNQNTKRFGFRVRDDADAPNIWTADEVPASQSAIDNVGLGMADDHLNVKVASDGTLYAAVKTSYDTAGYTKVAVLVRRPAGTWDDLYHVDYVGTRGNIELDEVIGVLTYLYTQSENYNPIVYKQSALSPISFGSQMSLRAESFNDVSSTKQNYNNELVVIYGSSTQVAGQICMGDAAGADLVLLPADLETAHSALDNIQIDVAAAALRGRLRGDSCRTRCAHERIACSPSWRRRTSTTPMIRRSRTTSRVHRWGARIRTRG